MFLPKDINDLYTKFADKVYTANLLDKKTKELIALACSVMADCVPCIKEHYKGAVKAGATKEEIAEALAISMSVSAGSKRAKYSPIISDLEHDVIEGKPGISPLILAFVTVFQFMENWRIGKQ